MTATETSVVLPTGADLAERCRADGEFAIATRRLTGGLRIETGSEATGVRVADGVVVAEVPERGADTVTLAGDADVWSALFAPTPEPMSYALATLVGRGLELDADPLRWWQQLPATERLVELLRTPGGERAAVDESGATPRADAPTGHYTHIELGGLDHRIYWEEAGSGIPLLLQHTAGAHSLQWRHLFECSEITDHFRLIAYDLPHHGKSIPPVDARWWEEPYLLEGHFLRQVPVQLAAALELDRPVFMGCSVGGLLALDLALHHPDQFRAVVSLEGALRIGGDWDGLIGLFHPQVSNMTKARMMEGLCSPTSPEAYVKEVSHVYSAGWPPAFIGDLHYYMVDFDITETAQQIDTSRVGVHILNGEYDYTGSVRHGLAAHAAIAGSTHTVMDGVGHFPMQENPDAFLSYLLPVLEQVAASA